MKTNIKKRLFNIDSNHLILSLLCLILTFFCIIGSLLSCFYNTEKSTSLYLEEIFIYNGFKNCTSTEIFFNGIFRYGRYVTLIWLLGFTESLTAVTAVLALKGLSLGFVSSLIIYCTNSVFNTISLLLVQNMLILPLYIILAFFSINSIIKNKTSKKDSHYSYNNKEKNLFLHLLIGYIFVVIVSLFDAVITPLLICS